MAIRGNLNEASLADVLQLLALGQKTGVLSVARDGSFGTIHFGAGRIVHASLVNRRERLGDRLVRTGALSADELARLRTEAAGMDERHFAEYLLQASTVDRDLLLAQYRQDVEETVYHLFGWTQGSFTFEAADDGSVEAPLLSLSTDSLLLEGARRVDEWSVIARKIPSLDLIFEIDAHRVGAREVGLSADQERLLPLLDGSLDVQGVIDRSGLGEYEVGKALYGLVTAGFIQRVGRSVGAGAAAPEHRVVEHRTLGVAFYRTGLYEEALREFRKVLSLRHADAVAQFHIGLVHVRRREWGEAIAAFTRVAPHPEAPAAVLANLALALEQIGEVAHARTVLDEALRRAGPSPDPRLPLARAMRHLADGEVAAAEQQLEMARTLWGARHPSAGWYQVAGLVAALTGDLERATALLEEGIAAHPQATALHNNLAVVHERCGRLELAARAIEHALLQDADCAHLHKNLGDYHYRAHRYDEAFEAYTRAVRLAPRLGPDVFLKLGNLHYRLGHMAEARTAWAQVLALDPTHRLATANLASLERTEGTEGPGRHQRRLGAVA